MAFIIIGAWLGLLQVLVKTGVLKGWALWMKVSPVIIYAFYFVIIAIPMNFTAPSGAVVAMRESVQVSPAVSGLVTAVPVTSGTVVEPGTILFEIDPEPYAAAVAALEAEAELASVRLNQAEELVSRGTGRAADVQQYAAELAGIEANLRSANWNLEQIQVRAPARGFVPHVALEPGTQVSPQRAVMTFVDTEEPSHRRPSRAVEAVRWHMRLRPSHIPAKRRRRTVLADQRSVEPYRQRLRRRRQAFRCPCHPSG